MRKNNGLNRVVVVEMVGKGLIWDVLCRWNRWHLLEDRLWAKSHGEH